ncbi:hypothetical protein KIW84_064977 [Lathyrus oleraceus]|uniref:Uncharacterized protein n=1 Tax=Pisum sativum TaxID=3888 RepID=A0A9D4WE69_PEA|nr:hypothetical protein KIW84_064977 [Pisum sativum]
MLPESLMGASSLGGHYAGVHVKVIPNVMGIGFRKLFGESLPHYGLPEQSHSPTPGSYYAGRASELPAYNSFIEDHRQATRDVFAHEQITFLTYSLSKYSFCARSIQVAKKYVPFATQLYKGKRICMSQLILLGLYESLALDVADMTLRVRALNNTCPGSSDNDAFIRNLNFISISHYDGIPCLSCPKKVSSFFCQSPHGNHEFDVEGKEKASTPPPPLSNVGACTIEANTVPLKVVMDLGGASIGRKRSNLGDVILLEEDTEDNVLQLQYRKRLRGHLFGPTPTMNETTNSLSQLEKEHTHSSNPGSYYAGSSSGVCASTQNTSKVSEVENPFEVFRRIFENSEVLSPNIPASPIDNYNEHFGQLESKLAGIDLLQVVRDNPIVLFEIQGLLNPSKLDVPGSIGDIVLALEC